MSRNSPGSQTNAQSGWFLLFDENYEGPISFQDLQMRIESAAIPRDTLLWQAGRDNWEPIAHFPEFKSYVDQLPVILPRFKAAAVLAAPLVEVAPAPRLSRKSIEKQLKETIRAVPVTEPNEYAWLNFIEKQGYALTEEVPSKKSEVPPRQKTIALASIVGTTYFALRTPMPTLLAQLETNEREELYSTITTRGSNKAAIALLNRDLFAPIFVITTNVPANTPLSLHIDGIEETLVGEFRVSLRANLVFKDGVATTPPFRRANGVPYPHGSYNVSVWSQPANEPAILLSEKVFWLNPKSADYKNQINAYHEKLRAQAHDELGELEQVAKTLASQLDETAGEFELFSKNSSKNAAKNWSEFSARWTRLQAQLDSLFSRWTPEALESAYYHASSYKALKALGGMTAALHRAQSEFALSPLQGRELIVGAQASKLRASLKTLQDKITMTQDQSPLASGLPAKLD